MLIHAKPNENYCPCPFTHAGDDVATPRFLLPLKNLHCFRPQHSPFAIFKPTSFLLPSFFPFFFTRCLEWKYAHRKSGHVAFMAKRNGHRIAIPTICVCVWLLVCVHVHICLFISSLLFITDKVGHLVCQPQCCVGLSVSFTPLDGCWFNGKEMLTSYCIHAW